MQEQEHNARYKLGTCTITSFGDDEASRDASLLNHKLNAEKHARESMEQAKSKSVEHVMSARGDAVTIMPDEYQPEPLKVSVRRIKIGYIE